MRVRRGFASGKANLKIQCHPLRPSYNYQDIKNKNFFRKEARPLCRNRHNKTKRCVMPRLLRSGLQNKISGAGVVRARPPLKKAEKIFKE
jgi:hypothetical protein